MSKMLDEAIENYLKNMKLNINFFISFLDKNSYKKVGKIPTFYFFYKYLSNAFFNLS